MEWNRIYSSGHTDAFHAKGERGRRYTVTTEENQTVARLHTGIGPDYAQTEIGSAFGTAWSDVRACQQYCDDREEATQKGER